MKRYRELAASTPKPSALVELFRRYEQRERDSRPTAARRDAGATPRWPSWRARKSRGAERRPAERLHGELQAALLPRDPDDERNVFLEIRAGTGGDESALFAGDLARMYLRYAERQRLAHRGDVARARASSAATRKWCSASRATRVYGQLQVRVRRPPRAARAGDRDAGPHPHQRLHGRRAARARRSRGGRRSTRPSCASTPSAPAAPAASTSTRPTAPSASRTCRPASSPSARTTARSTATRPRRWRCWRRGCARRSARERAAKEAATRKSLIGSGDRSDRIRTYNFPQGRVTDHRISLTLYKLQAILDGDLDEVDRRAAGGAGGRAARRARERRVRERPSSPRRSREARARGVATARCPAAARPRCSAARPTRLIAHDDERLGAGRRRALDRLAGAPRRRRAARLPARREGVPRPAARGDAGRAGAPSRDRARSSTGPASCWRGSREPAARRRPRHRQRRDRPGRQAGASRRRGDGHRRERRGARRRAAQRPAARARRRVRRGVLVAGLRRPALRPRRWPTRPTSRDGDPHLAALRHEPRAALTPGGDGLAALREIVAGARRAPGAGRLAAARARLRPGRRGPRAARRRRA